MNLFSGLTIARRLVLIFVIFILGFGALTLSYQQLLQIDHENAALIENASAFGGLVSNVDEHLNALRDKADAFLLYKDIRYAEDFFSDSAFYQIQNHIDKLEALIDEPRILGLLSQLREAFAKYGDIFDTVVNAQVLVGFNVNSGFLGDARLATHEIEDVLQNSKQNQGQARLMVSLLQMRRYEKDFIERKDSMSIRKFRDVVQVFSTLLDHSTLPENKKDVISHMLRVYGQMFNKFIIAVYRLEARVEDSETIFQVIHGLSNSLHMQRTAMIQASAANAKTAETKATFTMSIIMVLVATAVGLMLLFLALNLRRSLKRLGDTVQQISEGNMGARTQLTSRDELGVLGQAFDTLLSERVATLANAEQENEVLNESIISIIGTVAQMSQKDLTIKAVVAEDVTGTIADALNLMARETSDVLLQIKSVSRAVGQAADAVRGQAEKVNEVAANERELVKISAAGLHTAGQALSQLAQGAQGANVKADMAMARTRQALAAVNTSVQGIDRIREIIRETEKRIKRLGERSQEINGAVNLINAIAERTHILALNASMHAASAGEAGRGFAVVADEVQRLAESSQKATSDISTMVNAIREETSEALETMNRLVAQVAEGTRQAQEAGQKMRETETTTTDLVQAVQIMAEGADKQAQSALELRKQSQSIVRSTEQTSVALQEQSTYTSRLVEYAETLQKSVEVFRLPTSGS